ncbi:unnamed protein product, partial [Linum tenue]
PNIQIASAAAGSTGAADGRVLALPPQRQPPPAVRGPGRGPRPNLQTEGRQQTDDRGQLPGPGQRSHPGPQVHILDPPGPCRGQDFLIRRERSRDAALRAGLGCDAEGPGPRGYQQPGPGRVSCAERRSGFGGNTGDSGRRADGSVRGGVQDGRRFDPGYVVWGGGEEGGGAAPDFAAEYREATREMTELLGRANVSDVIPLLARFDLQGIQREAAEVAERFDGIITSVVQRRLKDLSSGKSVPSKDLLQILLEIQSREDSLIASSSLHFKAMIQDIASGGTESIAILLEWAMTELLSNKEAMTKIQQELDLIVGPNNFVEQRHLKELNYLNAVVKETCRLHLGLTPRLAGQPCTIGGYHIPKGAAVFVNTWAIHRDPQNWAEPLQFRPERFLDSCEDGPRFDFMGSSFQFLPFGSGRRVCVGLNLAERLMKYVLASMLHSFEWKLPDGEEKLDFSDKLGVVAKKVKPLVAIPFPRRLGKLGCEVQF